MNREGHEQATMFMGTEVEHSAAHGMKTLFVVGLVPAEQVLQEALRHDVEHIYLGANQSFGTWGGILPEWHVLITSCIDKGYWVTLDYDVNDYDEVMSMELQEGNRFISMISVKLPNIRKLNYNATLKIDDTDFESTNPGVWCHSVHSLQKRKLFTDWSKYTNDQIIEEEVK